MKRLMSAALAFSALLGVTAFAQATGGAPPPGGAGAPPGQSQEPEQQEPSSAIAPVLWVSSVETLRSSHGPQLDVIRARGFTSTEGWQQGELVPLTKGPSPDGMLDLVFVAQAPSESSSPGSFPEIEAVFTIEPGHPYKGVRIHSATNRVTLKSIPGYAEATAAPNDCSQCVGKYFIGKGESAPSGASAADSIHEEALPKLLRVIKATDGIDKFDSDPNRLTLVLGEDGKIQIAVWD